LTGSVGAAWLAIAAAGGGPVGAQQHSALGLTAVRFYRQPGPETLFEVFCRVPLTELTPAGIENRDAAYRIAVLVRDSSGLELLTRSWSRTVAGSLLRIDEASNAEHFQFAARPGRYVIEVAVTDSGTGRVSRQRSDVSAYATRPRASDLLVAGAVRRAALGDTTPRAGEIRKGGLMVETSGWAVATPEHAQLGYYLELYAERPETAAVVARVVDRTGKELASAGPQRIALPASGGVAAAMLDLSGLPPGDYRLVVGVATPDSQVERAASFAMTGFGRSRDVAADTGPMASDSLARLPEAQLDSMYAPLMYLMVPDERGVYPGLTADGKRAFLRQFWKKRDPTPGTAANEAEEQFYRTVAEANRQFREGGAAAVPGWRTDRGRIYIRNGTPAEVLDRGQAGSARPYVVWKYTVPKPHRYVFFDATSLGNYQLIWTDDRREPSRPDWQELLGPEAAADVQRF
jgi:GWxTD domain-containing protein